jgi:hypothetical protein
MMEILFNLDKYLLDLINGSGLVVLLGLGVLKILAKETAWAADDKIVNLLLGVFKPNKE